MRPTARHKQWQKGITSSCSSLHLQKKEKLRTGLQQFKGTCKYPSLNVIIQHTFTWLLQGSSGEALVLYINFSTASTRSETIVEYSGGLFCPSLSKHVPMTFFIATKLVQVISVSSSTFILYNHNINQMDQGKKSKAHALKV